MLLDEKPLIILPSLAVVIGLNEAIVIQQLHYWLKSSKNYVDGLKWVYNTIQEWEKQFPFWNERTIRRIFKNLETKNLVITANHNKYKLDRTKWYTINYSELDKLSDSSGQTVRTETDNLSESNRTNCPVTFGQTVHTNNHRIPETTTETTRDIFPFSEIVDYLNEKCGTQFKSTTKKTKDLIKARYAEGFGINDFKHVIDIKSIQWINDKKMSEYLRPETLFGNKFESYLNQKGGRLQDGSNTNSSNVAQEYAIPF